jgi:hypothetical protein
MHANHGAPERLLQRASLPLPLAGADTMNDTDICVCGHVRDEHVAGNLFNRCVVEGCDCLDFEHDEDAETVEEETP